MTYRRVVVSGLGTVSAYGIGTNPFWAGITRGESAARMLDFAGVDRLPTRFAAPVPLDNGTLEASLVNPKAAKTMSRAALFGIIAATEAAAQAGLAPGAIDADRLGTSLGMGGLGLFDVDYVERTFEVASRAFDRTTGSIDRDLLWRAMLDDIHPLSPLKALPNIATAHMAIQFGARAQSNTITTACTSGAHAIGEAFRMIRSNQCDAVIAGGSDAMVNPNGIVAFSALGVLSVNNTAYRHAARPFDRERDGFMLGEGAGVLILEEMRVCRARGATPLAEIVGYASTSDAHRLTDEPPQAWGAIAAMRGALADAGLPADAIDYINVHGTGTAMNDKTETFAIRRVFGHHADRLAVSSTKSMIGHLVAAAGAVECAACVLALHRGVLPPTINYATPDPDCDLDCIPNTARHARARVVMSNSFGFGGQNVALVLQAIA